MRAPLRFDLPREGRAGWPTFAASLLAHAVVLAVVVSLARVQVSLVQPESRVRLAELPAYLGPTRPPPVAPMPAARSPEPGSSARPSGRSAERPGVAHGAVPDSSGAVRDSSGAAAGAGPEAGTGGLPSGRIGAALASGKLWVRPLPLPPRELAARLTGDAGEMPDSVVSRVIQAFLDSLAADPASRGAQLPSWTTNIAGAKFGLDSKWIHVAGLRIPAALLALLPIPFGGNEQRAFDRSEWLYEDLRQASQRSSNLAEFKTTIQEIRERKEAEREFERNRRTPPPSDKEPTLQPLAP
ncbi:MAG TPA: hypothetical protein VFS94_10680 [Gemmatimonadales bacterium]|nr:hypothetical protein [Gemmatimonadales bacterium]